MNEQYFLEQFNSLEDFEIVDERTRQRIAWAEGLSQTYSTLYAEAWGDELAIDQLNAMLYEELEAQAMQDPEYGSVVYVTGLIERQVYDAVEKEFTSVSVECTDVDMIHAGFTARFDEAEQRLHVMHRFDTGDKIQHVRTGHLQDTVTRLFAGAPVGSVQVDTPEFGVKQIKEVEYAHPQIVAMLDQALTSSDDYAEVFQHMGRCIVPDRLNLSERHRVILRNYAENILALDADVPYRADIKGTCTLDTGDAHDTVLNIESVDGILLRSNALTLQKVWEYDQENNLQRSRHKKWGLHATIIAKQGETNVDAIIPVEAIQSFVSVRDIIAPQH